MSDKDTRLGVEGTTQKIYRLIAVIAFVFAFMAGAVEVMDDLGLVKLPFPVHWNISKVSFFVGLAAIAWRLHADYNKLATTLQRQYGELTDKVQRIMNVEEKLDQKLAVERLVYDVDIFLRPTQKLISQRDNIPQLAAFLSTGERFVRTHMADMVNRLREISDGREIYIEDPPVTADFLRFIVNALASFEGVCVWMGISLVVDPSGWHDQKQPLFVLNDSLKNLVAEGKLSMHRLYIFSAEPERSRRQMSKMRGHMEEEIERKMDIKIHFTDKEIDDITLLFLPTHNSSPPITPATQWEQLRGDGWKLVCGIKWLIRDHSIVEGAYLYSEGDVWLENKYRQLSSLWRSQHSDSLSSTSSTASPSRGVPPSSSDVYH